MILFGLEIALSCGAVSGCSYVWYKLFGECVNSEVDMWLSEASKRTRSDALVLKSEFQRAEVKPAMSVLNHTHGVSAAERSTASLLMRRIALGCGRTPYYFQGSGADARAGRAYSRTYFWAKDLMAPYQDMSPGSDDVICMVDVDYYIDDLDERLVDRFQPYMLYTLVPSAAGKDVGDYDYRFLADGKCEYGVNGGGRYTHYLWNWDGDSLRIIKRFMGVPVAMACYGVERRQMGDDHQIILLVPLVRTQNPLWVWLARDKVMARELKRFNPVTGGFVRFYTNKPGRLEVTTGIVGGYASSSVPASTDDIIASTARTISGKLTRATVLSKLDGEHGGKPVDRAASEILLEFHLKGAPTRERVSLVDTVRRFQWVEKTSEYDEDAKAGMTSFMQPLLDGGFVPDICLNNEKRMVEERVKKVKSEDIPVSKYMMDMMEEFIERLVDRNGLRSSLDPHDVDEVYRRQSKPSQRAILAEAEHTSSTGLTKQFIKREAYGSVNDPRGISTICGPDKREFSRYMYKFTDEVLKGQAWYAFGKTPREVAERVAEVAQAATFNGANKDFSRMDGRHSNVLHLLERMAYTRAFREEHHSALLEVLDRHHHLRAKTVFGVVYETEYQRLSGGADTSAANTMDTAFIAFLTYRMQGLGPDEAWGKLGVYGGDDGFDTDVSPTVAAKAAKMVGQVLDLQVIEKGETGVSFLARRYGPDVWYGDTNSCCDVKRQLAKFHLTVNLPGKITPAQKLAEKSFSFYLTDRNTPVIGEFVSKALELYPMSADKFANRLGIWGVETDDGKQYPNHKAEWMDDIVRAELKDFDFDSFRDWVGRADSTTILNPPRLADPVPPNPKPGRVAVDGDFGSVGDDGGADGPTGGGEGRPDAKAHFRPRKPKKERDSSKMKKGSAVVIPAKPKTDCQPVNPRA